MSISIAFNGSTSGSHIVVAPWGNRDFPVPLVLKTTDGSTRKVRFGFQRGVLDVSQDTLEVTPEEQTVIVTARLPSQQTNDMSISILVDGVLDKSLSVTSVENPRVLFDGRFEARFATGAGAYNHTRGNPDGTGRGWMWALEDEPNFVPMDSIPDRLDKPVGRVVRFHNGAIDRMFVPPIGVFVRAIECEVGGATLKFEAGDPIIGSAVNLGEHSYFASNIPVSPADAAAGRLPEEQHPDGLQPIANFACSIGTAFTGGSKIGPYVAGTQLSRTPRDPDFRPFGRGLEPMSSGEAVAYPFPSLVDFETQRLDQLLTVFERLKSDGEVDTVEFRNLRTRIGHILGLGGPGRPPRIEEALRQNVLDAHSDVGLVPLNESAAFAWGNREVYRGTINDGVQISRDQPGVMEFMSRFVSFNFLCVFFNFHTDESRGHCYGAIDPLSLPPTIGDVLTS